MNSFQTLNKEQHAAAETLLGPAYVCAGPGTGKTHMLLHRIQHILEHTDALPSHILCLTFSTAGVRSMKRKLHQLIGEKAEHVCIGTFDSFEKGMGKPKDQFQYILVDEFEEIGFDQLKFLEHLMFGITGPNIFIVGDGDQCIHQFHEAFDSGIRHLEQSFGIFSKFTLSKNHRSLRPLLNATYHLIKNTPNRPAERTELEWQVGTGKEYSLPLVEHMHNLGQEFQQVAEKIAVLIKGGNAPHQMAVLFRERSMANGFIPWLVHYGIPFFWNSPDQDILNTSGGYEEQNPERVIVLSTIHDSKGLEFDHVFMPCCSKKYWESAKDSTSDISIQESVKKQFPTASVRKSFLRRQAYVGMTRARKNLVLTYSGNSAGNHSFFIRELFDSEFYAFVLNPNIDVAAFDLGV